MFKVKKNRNIMEMMIIFISILVILELFYAPHAGHSKILGEFPLIQVMGYSFLITELFISGFIIIGLFKVMLKVLKSKKISLGPSSFQPFILVFGFSLFLSLMLGIFNSNLGLLSHFREMVFPLFLYLIFTNLNISESTEKQVFNIFLTGLSMIMISNFIIYFYPDFFDSILPSFGLISWYTLTLIILVFCISFSKIVFGNFNLLWFLLCAFSVLTIVLHLVKPVIWAFLWGFVCLLLIGFKNKVLINIRQVSIILIILFFVIITIINFPQSRKSEMLHTIVYRYLNIGRGEVEGDLSTGRFEIWNRYLLKSLHGFGISPRGFGNLTEIEVLGRSMIDKGAHNILVYYSYHGGYITSISLLILIIKYILFGFKKLNYEFRCKGLFQRYELIGIFAFTISILSINMVNLMIADWRTAWIFWFCVVLFLKRMNNKTGDLI